ncbi:hypothetical protein [Methylocella sp.]|jgi:hypothetical protein|uniref:hypothetical protein n=1 Tax=Methylocella sp. TaxID=1978226 RepID=UPI003C2848AC
MGMWTAKMKGRDIVVSSDRLARLRRFWVPNSDLSARMSELLWLDIYVLEQESGISAPEVLEAVNNLEDGELHNGVKPATQFRNLPLKGLWHKHFSPAHFLVNNLLLGLGKNGLKTLVEEALDPSKSSVITQGMIDELAYRVAYEPVENRCREGKMTGEWLIFAKHDGKNYYLCLNSHGVGDQFIYDRIMTYCTNEFPKLAEWVSAS